MSQSHQYTFRGGHRIVEETEFACYCDTVFDPSFEKVIVIFKYRLHDWLVAHKKIAGESDEDDVCHDSARSKRRDRDEPGVQTTEDRTQSRRVRVSLQR
jgi:hypothetical protein